MRLSTLTKFSVRDLVVSFSLIVIFLQVLRNFSTLYFSLYLLSVFFLAIFVLNNPAKITSGYKLFLIFYVYCIWLCVYSLLYEPSLDPINVFGRYLFLPTIILIFGLIRFDDYLVKRILHIYIAFSFLAVLSYVYQFNYGPVSWFADTPMERGSLVRYSTTMGSGNIFGIVVGMALYIAFSILHGRVRKMCIMFLLLGAIMSLQKAAIINIFLAVFFYLVSFGRRHILLSCTVASVTIALIIVVAWVYQSSLLSVFFQEFIFNSIGLNIFDNPDLIKSTVITVSNLTERFTGIHLGEIFSMHSEAVIVLFGVGAVGAGGAMGAPEFPQAHNSYWDLLFMGGLPFLLLFLGILVTAQVQLYLNEAKISKVFFFLNFIFIINSLSASTSFLHPYIGILFWVSLIYSSQHVKRGRCFVNTRM